MSAEFSSRPDIFSKWLFRKRGGLGYTNRDVGNNRLGLVAIRKTLLRKQTAFGGLITWLEVELKRLESRKGIKDLGTMLKVAEGSCGY